MKLVLVALVAAVRGDDYCPDDPDWHKSNKPSRDCAWVGENVPTRCTIKGEDKAYSYASCQVQCQGAARSCGGDSTSWFKNGNPSKDCDWARAGAAVLGPRAERESAARDGRDHASAAQVSKSPSARCDVVGKDGTVAGQACASSCVVPCAGSHTYETISSLYNIGYGCTSVDELDLSDARPRRPKHIRRVAPALLRLGRGSCPPVAAKTFVARRRRTSTRRPSRPSAPSRATWSSTATPCSRTCTASTSSCTSAATSSSRSARGCRRSRASTSSSPSTDRRASSSSTTRTSRPSRASAPSRTSRARSPSRRCRR